MVSISRDGTSEATTSSASSASTSPPQPRAQISIPGTSTSFHIPRKFHSMTAGAGAGLVSSIVTCPLDVVKTQLQAQHLARTAKEYEGVQMTIAKIWRQSGFKGFYRGLGPTLGGYLPTWGIYFTVYDLVKDRLGRWVTGGGPGGETALVHVAAAMTAGGTGTILTNPLWVVKTRFMAQAAWPPSSAKYKHTLQAFASIYRNEGFRAFYKGLLPSLMGVSHVAVQFPLYEKAKQWADRDGDHSSLTPSTILMCSAFSKMVASLITYPHEVLRTRLQIRKENTVPPSATSTSATASASKIITPTGSSTSPPRLFPPSSHPLYSPLVAGSYPPTTQSVPNSASPASVDTRRRGKAGGVIDTFLSIRRQDGWRGFYRGLSINLVRTVPNSAVTMLTYELIMRRLS